MKWTEKLDLPCQAEAIAGPLVLVVWNQGDGVWAWQIREIEYVVIASGFTKSDNRSEPQARCLAVANGILLQRVREAWGQQVWLRRVPSRDEASREAIWSPRFENGMKLLPVGGLQLSTETESLLAALEAAP